jgi:hypothetical protein
MTHPSRPSFGSVVAKQTACEVLSVRRKSKPENQRQNPDTGGPWTATSHEAQPLRGRSVHNRVRAGPRSPARHQSSQYVSSRFAREEGP